MKDFFILQRPSKNYQMNNSEQFAPIIIMILIIILIIVYRNEIRKNYKVEKNNKIYINRFIFNYIYILLFDHMVD